MKKKILLSAYACEPEEGSEHGIGWGWINFLVKNNFKVEVITRLSNKAKIEKHLKKNNIKNIIFHYYDIKGFIYRILKSKNNSHTYLYFIIWQFMIFYTYRNYIKKNNFDFIQHVTFASTRFPSFLGLCHKNFLFGPVAGLENIPIQLIKTFNFKEKITEIIRFISNFYTHFSPLMNLTFLTSKKILISSDSNFNKISKIYQKKTKIIFATRLIKKFLKKPVNIKLNYKNEFKILFVGRLESWKGINIILETFYKLNNLNTKKKFKLLIRGDGPLKKKINEFIYINQLKNKIILLPRSKNLVDLYSEASLFFFPSLRETGGMALLESMSVGVPPAVINNGGPGIIVKRNCGIVVNHIRKNENQVINSFVNKILDLSNNRNKAILYSKNSHKRVDEFIWSKKLLKIYNLK